MKTVKAVALVRNNYLLRLNVILSNGDNVELMNSPQYLPTLTEKQHYIRKLLCNNHFRVGKNKFFDGTLENVYYIDLDALTVERLVSLID